jgi:hypothetical protein
MFTCIVCRFTHRLDDVAVSLSGHGRCICLACFAREAGAAKPMPKALRHQIINLLAGVDVVA